MMGAARFTEYESPQGFLTAIQLNRIFGFANFRMGTIWVPVEIGEHETVPAVS